MRAGRGAGRPSRRREASELTRAHDWIITGQVGGPPEEIYKFLNLRGEPFERFRVRLTVVRGTTANVRTTFVLKRLCNFEGLLYIFVFVAITIVFGASGGLMLVIFWKPKAR